MRIISPDQLVVTDVSQLKPYDRYVVADCEFDTLKDRTPHTNWEWSSFNSYERRYGGQDLNGKRVCIYRHSAFGDQLMVSALPRYLKAKYPQALIHLYCHPSVQSMWYGNPFVDNSAISLPIPFDAMKRYDYHIFFEGMLEGNSETDQSCCYDDMFDFCGCRNVPDGFKRPHFQSRPEDYKTFNDLALSRPYLVYHLSPANPNRMYPWDQGMDFIQRFHAERPDWMVLIVGQKTLATGTKLEVNAAGMMQQGEYPWLVDLTDKTPDFRQLAAILENAKIVVCPDSSVMHLAAAFPQGPQVISLWGLFNPNDRMKYYPKNTPLYFPSVCPYAPCRSHNFELPLERCAKAKQHKAGFCQCLASITPEELTAVVCSQAGKGIG